MVFVVVLVFLLLSLNFVVFVFLVVVFFFLHCGLRCVAGSVVSFYTLNVGRENERAQTRGHLVAQINFVKGGGGGTNPKTEQQMCENKLRLWLSGRWGWGRGNQQHQLRKKTAAGCCPESPPFLSSVLSSFSLFPSLSFSFVTRPEQFRRMKVAFGKFVKGEEGRGGGQ